MEKEKGRRRWIVHTPALNDASKDSLPLVVFPTPAQIIEQVWKKRFATTIDFSAFFQHFPMEKNVAVFFGVLKQGRAFVPTTIPTGASHPPLLAQLLVETICDAVRTSCQVEMDCWIDNVRILADEKEDVRRATKRIFQLCRELGITINESEDEASTPKQQYTYLGIAFDHSRKTVDITEKARTKIAAAAKVLEEESASTEEWVSLFSRCVWTSTILNIDRSEKYYVYKFCRRKLNGDNCETVKLWPSIRDIWKNWVSEVVNSFPRVVAPRLPKYTVYTDASLSGFGGVIFGEEGDTVIAGAWSMEEHINLLELKAVRRVLERWDVKGPVDVKVVMDSTSAIGQIRRGYARRFASNEEVKRLKKFLMHKGINITSIEYITSAMNPADKPSRIHN